MPSNQNYDDDDDDDDDAISSSIRKRFKTIDNMGVASWSDLNDDVLFLVMMQLGFVDFFAFSGVCKSWRSFALSSRNTFMASKPPMSICNSMLANEDDWCSFEDIEGNTFKTIIPHLTGRFCVGSTCGYLILYGKKTRDFWLVNPITRNQLHFPNYPIHVPDSEEAFRGILLFSPSISGWVFLVLHKTPWHLHKRRLSFCMAGKRRWNHVSSNVPIRDMYLFKGKIYTLHTNSSLHELRLSLNHQKRKSTLLEIINPLNPDLFQQQSYALLVSSGENLYMMTNCSIPPTKVLELDFDEMKWVSPEKSIRDYAFFISQVNSAAAIKLESSVGPRTQHKTYDYFPDNDESRKCVFFYERMWYLPHDCMNINLLDEY